MILMEALVAGVLFVLAVVGYVDMLRASVWLVEDSYSSIAANILVQDMQERMLLNKDTGYVTGLANTGGSFAIATGYSAYSIGNFLFGANNFTSASFNVKPPLISPATGTYLSPCIFVSEFGVPQAGLGFSPSTFLTEAASYTSQINSLQNQIATAQNAVATATNNVQAIQNNCASCSNSISCLVCGVSLSAAQASLAVAQGMLASLHAGIDPQIAALQIALNAVTALNRSTLSASILNQRCSAVNQRVTDLIDWNGEIARVFGPINTTNGPFGTICSGPYSSGSTDFTQTANATQCSIGGGTTVADFSQTRPDCTSTSVPTGSMLWASNELGLKAFFSGQPLSGNAHPGYMSPVEHTMRIQWLRRDGTPALAYGSAVNPPIEWEHYKR